MSRKRTNQHRWKTFVGIICLLLAHARALGQPSPALPAIKTVDYSPRGALRVNGKPFFPIFLYDAPLEEATLRELRAFGFNVLACDAKASLTLPAQGFYGMVHGDRKMDDVSGVFLGLGADSPALNFKKDLLGQVAEANARTRAAVPGRPVMNAVGYWEDEPQGVMQGKLPGKALYEDLIANLEVSAPYLYPVPYQPIASVGEAVARARRASAGKKPLLPVLQLFVWEAKDRYPTPAELRCMAYLALLEGAHGIGYYSYGSITGRAKTTIAAVQPELWMSVKKLNGELAEFGPRLAAGAETDDLKLAQDDQAVKMKLVRDDQGILAVLVNPTTNRQAVKLMSRQPLPARLNTHSGRPVEIQQQTATLSLEAFGVEVIRLAKPE